MTRGPAATSAGGGRMIAHTFLIWMVLASALAEGTAARTMDTWASAKPQRSVPARTAEYRLQLRDPSVVSLAPTHF